MLVEGDVPGLAGLPLRKTHISMVSRGESLTRHTWLARHVLITYAGLITRLLISCTLYSIIRQCKSFATGFCLSGITEGASECKLQDQTWRPLCGTTRLPACVVALQCSMGATHSVYSSPGAAFDRVARGRHLVITTYMYIHHIYTT